MFIWKLFYSFTQLLILIKKHKLFFSLNFIANKNTANAWKIRIIKLKNEFDDRNCKNKKKYEPNRFKKPSEVKIRWNWTNREAVINKSIIKYKREIFKKWHRWKDISG